jgi:uncharacterized membrane protein
MHKGRLEAFSDGVIAILITIMVLEFRAPEHGSLAELRPLVTTFLAYVLSFVFLGIYWNNHHHMLQSAHRVNGAALWANMHLLFWLSLIPFATAWMGHACTEPWPTAVYGLILLFAGSAYFILSRVLVGVHGPESDIARALGDDLKGKLSLGLYLAAVPLAFASTLAAQAIYVAVAVIWLVPDRRFERTSASS